MATLYPFKWYWLKSKCQNKSLGLVWELGPKWLCLVCHLCLHKRKHKYRREQGWAHSNIKLSWYHLNTLNWIKLPSIKEIQEDYCNFTSRLFMLVKSLSNVKFKPSWSLYFSFFFKSSITSRGPTSEFGPFLT